MTISLQKGKFQVYLVYNSKTNRITARNLEIVRGSIGEVTLRIDVSPSLVDSDNININKDYFDFEHDKSRKLITVVIDDRQITEALAESLKFWGISSKKAAALKIVGSEVHLFELSEGFGVDELGRIVLRVRNTGRVP